MIGSWAATPDLIALGAARARRNPQEPTRLLFLGWLEREKGVFDLLEACLTIKSRAPFKLTFAGGGRAEVEAKTFVESNGLSPLINFAGWVRGDVLHQYLRDSDVLVLPSWAEGFPMAVVEAMAAGLAVVTTSVGVIPDVLTNGRDALIVPPHDPKQLSRAIERIISDAELRHSLQVAGYHFACDNFTPEPAAVRLSTVIRKAVGEHRADD